MDSWPAHSHVKVTPSLTVGLLKQAKSRVSSPRVSKGWGSGAMTYETLTGPWGPPGYLSISVRTPSPMQTF
jgi:hypothetical protein